MTVCGSDTYTWYEISYMKEGELVQNAGVWGYTYGQNMSCLCQCTKLTKKVIKEHTRYINQPERVPSSEVGHGKKWAND